MKLDVVMDYRPLVLFSVVILVFPTFFLGAASAQVTEVSDPGLANKILHDFSTPIIKPGNQGNLEFNLTNPYEFEMENMVLTAEIYGFGDLDEQKNISEIDDPPVFQITGDTSRSLGRDVISPERVTPQRFTLKTTENTEKGVYFVRFQLDFEYSEEGNESVMKSKGHFTDSEWDNATKRPGNSDEPYYAGSINITQLGVNGILPDTSFTVKTQIPRWPQYVLGGLAAFFGIFAVMLYMQEEYNSFPWLEDILDHWSGKFNQFRRRLKHRLRKR
ncbi:MAG: hypothetical protein R6W73_03585 [Candidatus Saliniplasma sp.]